MKRFGYWVFGKDMNNVNTSKLQDTGVTDIFLNYYAFTLYGENKVLSWINTLKKHNINTHIWMQCFYTENGWVNPVTNKNIIDTKIKEAKKYANLKNVYGVHLDYLRYPGNAYKTKNGTNTITSFVKTVREECPNIFLSCAVMPENDDDKYYYGQDISELGKVVDAILPMQYKGNYGTGSSWLASTSKYFSNKSVLWSGLQAYKSDDDLTLLSSKELTDDVGTCLSNGASGVFLFRYGLSPLLDFKKYNPTNTTVKSSTTTSSSKSNVVSASEIKLLATGVKKVIETEKKFPTKITLNNRTFTYGQLAYIFSYHINHLGKSCELFKVANAEKGNGDKVVEDIVISDYKDIAKRLSEWIKKNKQCPNYATTMKSKKRLRPRLVIYMMARIIAFYYKNNRLPNYCSVNYNFLKK